MGVSAPILIEIRRFFHFIREKFMLNGTANSNLAVFFFTPLSILRYFKVNIVLHKTTNLEDTVI